MRSLSLIGAVLLAGCGTNTAAVDDEPLQSPAAGPARVAGAAASGPDTRIAEMQVLMTELLDRIEVLNARLQRVESAGSAPAQVASVSTPPPQQPPPSSATSGQPAISRPLAGAALAERYRNALASYGKGELDHSRRLFQEVFDSEPNGDLADNALYWIAETYFVTAKYRDALKIYQRIITDYSEENKAPDAMLKMGLAYARLGDLSLARRTFQQLMDKYPYSTPASAAKQEIKRIQY